MLKFPTCILVLSCRRISFCREEWRQTGRISFLDSERTLEMALFNLIKMPHPIEQNNEIEPKVLDFFKEGNTQKYIAQYAFEGVEPKFSRAAAWNHLYVFIQDHLDELKDAKSDSELYSRACAELAAYLATFGMYRYSTKLMMTNKVIFASVLHSLIQTASEQNITAYQDRFSQDQIRALIDTTRSALKNAAKEVPLAATDTLTSKILHGTFGCIPAFDQFFVDGIRAANHLNRTYFFSEEEVAEKKKRAFRFPTNIDASFDALQAWVFNPKINSKLRELNKDFPAIISQQTNNKAEKDKVKKKEMPYPIMRIVDQVFWALGRFAKDENTINRNYLNQ